MNSTVTFDQLKAALAKAGVDFVITRKDGHLVHVNFWVEDAK